jgi:hypothetical protein
MIIISLVEFLLNCIECHIFNHLLTHLNYYLTLQQKNTGNFETD